MDPLVLRENIFSHAELIRQFKPNALLPHQVELVLELNTAEETEMRRQRRLQREAAGVPTPEDERSVEGSHDDDDEFSGTLVLPLDLVMVIFISDGFSNFC